MSVPINNQRIYQYNAASSHIITDPAETMKLLEKKCGYVKPWSMEEKVDQKDTTAPAATRKDLRKIDLYL